MAFAFRLFSFCPRVRKREGTLFAATAWRLRILTLGWHYRSVTVDPVKSELTIYRRAFWAFVRRRTIRFKDIEAVTYSYRDWGFSWTWAHDSVDLFSVGLRL